MDLMGRDTWRHSERLDGVGFAGIQRNRIFQMGQLKDPLKMSI